MQDGSIPKGRWSSGRSIDGKSQFKARVSEPLGEVPTLAPAPPDCGAQSEQSTRSGMTGLVGALEGAFERT
jgi:Mn-containing catalase